MYKVKVENSCRCFLRNGLPEEQSFSTKEEAEAEAESLLKLMQSTFCKKHDFHLSKSASGFKVTIQDR